jgi:hypothetical protein
MPDLEAIGDAATGGIIARAVEPRAGEAGDGPNLEGTCLNCGAKLEGPYCSECGQRGHVHRTLGAFWHDLVHGVLHFEGKIWRTLPLLAWRPGELTRRYVEGERARFVSPVALYLFTIFLTFAVFAVAGPDLGTSEMHNTRGEVTSSIEEEKRDLVELREDRAEVLRTGRGRPVEDIDRAIRETEEGIRALETFLKVGNPETNQMVGGKTGWKRLDERIKKFNANPQLALYKIQTNAYKFSWALIPISVPFVWLLFLHRRRYRQYGAYDHTVFVTYSITFMTLTLVLIALLTLVPHTGWLRTAMIVIPPLHMYRQLRGAYQLRWFSAAWRTLALLVFANIAIVLFLLLLLALGLMT